MTSCLSLKFPIFEEQSAQSYIFCKVLWFWISLLFHSHFADVGFEIKNELIVKAIWKLSQRKRIPIGFGVNKLGLAPSLIEYYSLMFRKQTENTFSFRNWRILIVWFFASVFFDLINHHQWVWASSTSFSRMPDQVEKYFDSSNGINLHHILNKLIVRPKSPNEDHPKNTTKWALFAEA